MNVSLLIKIKLTSKKAITLNEGYSTGKIHALRSEFDQKYNYFFFASVYGLITSKYV